MPKIRINYTRCPKCGGDGYIQYIQTADATYSAYCRFCSGTGRAPMEVIKVKEDTNE